MQDKEREEFFRLHAAQAGKKFNFQQDLYNNCLSDVEILKNGCLLFRKLVLEITKKDGVGIDPFFKLCYFSFCVSFILPSKFHDSKIYCFNSGFDPTQNYYHKQMFKCSG